MMIPVWRAAEKQMCHAQLSKVQMATAHAQTLVDASSENNAKQHFLKTFSENVLSSSVKAASFTFFERFEEIVSLKML